MIRERKAVRRVGLGVAALVIGLIGGCSKQAMGPVAPETSGVQVTATALVSGINTPLSLYRISGVDAADSIRIDSVVVVVARIRLHAKIDSVSVDSTGEEHEKGEREDNDSSVTLRGPFVVRVRDTFSVNFASQVVPAGAYDGVTFQIHRLMRGERHEDSDDRGHPGWHQDDSSVTGSSIVIWGQALKGGVWTPFSLNLDLELTVKIRGDFVIPVAVSSVNVAFNFDLGAWFRDPLTGDFLDPTDTSSQNRALIARAIRHALGLTRGGCDRDHDGRPDR